MLQFYEVPSLDATYRKPVIDGVITRVLAEAGMANTTVIYNNERWNTVHQAGSTLGDETAPLHSGTERVTVEIEEERDEYSRINTTPGWDRATEFFSNSDQVKAAPVLVRYNVTITMRRVGSKDTLQRWVNHLDSLLDMGRFSLMTESEAYYLIPRPALVLLNECYVAANTRKRSFESFKDYLVDGFGEHVTVVDSITGSNSEFAVRAAPTRIQVVYDPMTPVWDKEDNTYVTDFVVRFVYQCPEHVQVVYPHIINQTPLPDEYFPQYDPPWSSNEEGVSRHIVQMLEDATIYDNFARILIKLPYAQCPEEQLLATHSPWRGKELAVFASDIVFEADNMTNPLVLETDKLDYEWNPAIKSYIERCRRVDPTGMRCLIRFCIYEDGVLVDPKRYRWDGNVLRLEGEVQLEKHYYVVESVLTDWRGVDLFLIKTFPLALWWLLTWLFPSLDIPENWWELEKIPASIWDEVNRITGADGKDQTVGAMRTGVATTVMNTTIVALRHEGQYVARQGSGAYVTVGSNFEPWVNMRNRHLAELFRKVILDGFTRDYD